MSLNCLICLEGLSSPVSLPCGHVFCEWCLKRHALHSSTPSKRIGCPTCRKIFHNVEGATIRKLYLPYTDTVQTTPEQTPCEPNESDPLMLHVADLEARLRELENVKERTDRDWLNRMQVLYTAFRRRRVMSSWERTAEIVTAVLVYFSGALFGARKYGTFGVVVGILAELSFLWVRDLDCMQPRVHGLWRM